MFTRSAIVATAILLAAAGMSCTTSDDGISVDTESDANAANDGTNGAAGPTYHADVRPLLEEHCTSCHLGNGEGIAPFGLTRYDEVAPLAALLAESTADRRMPPWPPSQECAELGHPRVLAQADIEVLQAWADAGAPRGDEADYVAIERPEARAMPAPDLTIDIGADYKPNPPVAGSIDDYRCFVVDPQLEEDVWLNTHVTRPSNLQVAHHMLMHAVPGDQLAALRDREGQEPGPGYTCFGGPQVPGATLLGGWVPGSVASSHPPGHGIRVPAGSVFVVQMHYNIVSDPDGTDRTAIDLHFTEGPPERELSLSAISEPGLMIPAGATEDVERTEFQLPVDVDIFGVAPHMHLLGTSTRAYAIDSDGNETCLIDIPKWDFSWQGFYSTVEPIRLKRGSTVVVECTFDNSPENQPDGRAPQDVTWGDGTYDEMCITYFVVGR
jgi:hypothetical protein